MSYAFSVKRRGVRTAATLGAATLGLLATTGCGLTEPTSLTTVTVGSDTVTTEAACSAEEDSLSQEEAFKCLQKKSDASITVASGDRVRLGVEPDMAEQGWVYFVNQRPMSASQLSSTYQSFDSDEWFQPQPGQGGVPDSVTLSVATLGDDEIDGVWNVKIKRKK